MTTSKRRNYSRILPQFDVAFAAMLPTPRSVAISLVLLCGIARWLCAQAAPALTPGSVFYLKERVAVTTKAGVTGLNPGTGVRLISENGNTFRVTDGTTTFDVPKAKLTENINEATFAAQNYYATEQAGAQAFNAEVVRTQQERKRALDQQIAAAAQQRQREIQQEQIAAQQERRQLEAQQKQEAKFAAQKQARSAAVRRPSKPAFASREAIEQERIRLEQQQEIRNEQERRQAQQAERRGERIYQHNEQLNAREWQKQERQFHQQMQSGDREYERSRKQFENGEGKYRTPGE